MILKFKPEYFTFPIGECFTIRRGIKASAKGLTAILECGASVKYYTITDIMHMRLCDLLEDQALMSFWHLCDIGDPYQTIVECYPGIHEKEIVTLVWMVKK